MGIPSYFSSVVKKHGNVLKPLSYYTPMFFNNMYMDCNSIVYDAVRNIEQSDDNFELKLIHTVIHTIEDYIKLISPSNTIYIAFDGVAPFAKMNQQRTRRFKGDFMAKNTFINNSNVDSWSTANITPGTDFMNNLSRIVTRHFDRKEQLYGVKKIIVSASDIRGEGEHKIFHYIRDVNNKDENMLLYGLDSDLIMLTIFNRQYYNKGYIFREAPAFMNVNSDIKPDDKEPYVVDIEGMCSQLVIEMDCSVNEFRRVYDYVFMCFLLGNDFLPHFPGLNIRTHGLETLMHIYRKRIGNKPNLFIIKDDMTINWRVFKLLIRDISDSEQNYILDEYKSRDRFSKKIWKVDTEKEREYAFNSIPLIDRNIEHYICPTEPFWERRYYKALLNCHRDEENIKIICNNYIEGLEWTLKYYCGECPNWKWTYKYDYPPLFVDLINYLPDFSMEFIQPNFESFSPEVQLSYVLPPSKWDLLPVNIRNYLIINHPDIYNGKMEFKWAFCKYFWEAHVHSENINLEMLEVWNGKFKDLKVTTE
jgi:5'-3' exonuclease